MLEYLVFVGAFLTLVSAYVYINSMLKGGAKPNRVSWLMWCIAPFIATAAAISSGVGWAVLPVFMSGFGPFLIFIASFAIKKSYWKLAKFDYVYGGLSALALVLWFVTKDPNIAILFSIASDGLASVPTLTKAWAHPETESAWPYAVGAFNAFTALAAATAVTFVQYAFPTYLIIINLMLSLSIYNKKISIWLKT
jgi:hypothetical protein